MIDDIALHQEELRDLCRRFHVRRLDVFGSAARGEDFDPAGSDLDFLVEFQPLPPGAYIDAFFGLKEAWGSFSVDPRIWSPPHPSAIPISARASNRPRPCCTPQETKKYLEDIAQAAEMIAQFTAGKTFADYMKEAMLRAAVERKFESIDEALV